MTLFIQGMRRSGTTILYDALVSDPGLRCFYEPFREETETPGGGSGARDADPFAETRALRLQFRDARHPELAIEQFNWGGPREPALELESRLPAHCAGFLEDLVGGAGDGAEVMVKFTRMYCKVADLYEADPEALLIHVVRDPRAVAASMMLGRGPKRENRYAGADEFFAETEKRKLWSSRALSRALMKEPEFTGIRKPANFERILMVWKRTFESTWSAGRELFDDRYLLIRNEDLRVDTEGELRRIYAARGVDMPDLVADWAGGAVRAPETPFAGDDRRWVEAMARLGMAEAVRNAGYAELADRIDGAESGEDPARGLLARLTHRRP